MPFDSPDLNLGTELLTEIRCGKIRLPDFQHDWKWLVSDHGGVMVAGRRRGRPGTAGS